MAPEAAAVWRAEAGGTGRLDRRHMRRNHRFQLVEATANERGRQAGQGAAAWESKAGWPRAGPLSCDIRAAKGLLPPALPPLSLTLSPPGERAVG